MFSRRMESRIPEFKLEMKSETPAMHPSAAEMACGACGSGSGGGYGLSPSGELSAQLKHVSLLPLDVPTARLQMILDAPDADLQELGDSKDCILSQDFFCTPDYITPKEQQVGIQTGPDKDDVLCPRSPEKSVARSKRCRRDSSPNNSSSDFFIRHPAPESPIDAFNSEQIVEDSPLQIPSERKSRYVSQSAVVLRSCVMSPPCIKNPYMSEALPIDLEKFCRRSKLEGADLSPLIGDYGLSRYHTDFHEIEQIGVGNSSRVFKVLKRIDGCLYAVKKSIKQLRSDMERRCALMEVQAMAALGWHENLVGYYTSWFENEQLHMQLELCERSLLVKSHHPVLNLEEVLQMLCQIARALNFMHERGIAHLDVKPENIYSKNGLFKLGDFGCATMIDRSLSVEEGDARYMPPEILNDKYEYLDKVDIFSLGITAYELVRGCSLPASGPLFVNLRDGKIPLLPGCPMQLQNLIKAMMDPYPVKRPSAKEILKHAVFTKLGTKSSS